MNTRSRSSKKKQAKFLGIPPFDLPRNSKKLKKFSCKGQDGREMKIYLGTGCVPQTFGINEFVEKFPQFSIYERLSLASAFNRLKKVQIQLHLKEDQRQRTTMVVRTLLLINKSISFVIYFNILRKTKTKNSIQNFLTAQKKLSVFVHFQTLIRIMNMMKLTTKILVS